MQLDRVVGGQMQELDVAGLPLDEGADGGTVVRSDDVGVEPGRGVRIAPGPFPRPALRTGRATLIASGAPRTATAMRSPRWPLCWSRVWGCCSLATDSE